MLPVLSTREQGGAIPFDINVITFSGQRSHQRRQASGHPSGTPLRLKRREERLKIKRWKKVNLKQDQDPRG
jgi:hypothetical protein